MPTISTFITIEGFPYIIGDANVTSFGSPLTSHVEWPRGGVCFTNGFDPVRLRWTERCNPIDGTLEIDTLQLVVNDLHFATAEGQKQLFTYLTTRFPETLRSTELSASMTATDTEFEVFDASYITGLSLPAPVWIESECVLVASVAGTTATVASGGRGYLGTVATAHAIDASSSSFPEVFVDFPWFYKRKTLLWVAIEQSGTITSAKIVWRGHAARPELNEGQWTIASDSAWNTARETRLGLKPESTRLRGFNLSRMPMSVQWAELANTTGNSQINAGLTGIRNTFEDALLANAHQIDSDINTYETSSTIQLALTAQVFGNTAQATFVTRGVTSPGVSIVIRDWPAQHTQTTTGSDPAFSVARLTPIPPAIVLFVRSPGYIPINSTQGLANALNTTHTLFTESAQVEVELLGEYDENFKLRIRPASATPLDDNNTDYNGPTYYGSMLLIPAQEGQTPTYPSVIWSPVLLQQIATITCDHWFVGIAAIFASSITPYVSTDLDTRDWSIGETSETLKILSLTGGPFAKRIYRLDGKDKLIDILSPELKASACGLTVVDDARFSFFAFRQPTATEAAVEIPEEDLTIDSKDIQKFANDGMLVNSTTFEAPNTDVTVNEQRSIRRYKLGIDYSLEIKSMNQSTDVANVDFGSAVLTRLFGTWGHPRSLVTIEIPWSEYESRVRIGTWIKYSSVVLPDGQGNRRASQIVAQVLERVIDLDNNKMQLSAVVFPVTYGYAPCLRVASISGNTITFAGPGYVHGTSDYAGSDQADYAFAGTFANDGGVSWFKPNYACQLVARTQFGDIERGLVIATDGVDPANKQITFTVTIPDDPIDWSALLAANVIVDLRFDDFNSCTLEQQVNWPFIGSYATGLIDGTDTANRAWGA